MDFTRPYLIETSINGSGIRVRYADRHDPKEAKAWVDIQASFRHMQAHEVRIEEADTLSLAELQLAALRVAREIIGDEIKRLSATGSRFG